MVVVLMAPDDERVPQLDLNARFYSYTRYFYII
jgi:hypothetical protein